MSDKKQIQNIIIDLENQLENARMRLYELDLKDRLTLEVTCDNRLYILFNDALIGYILDNGECKILSAAPMIEVYENWRESGMKVDDSIVEWMGGKYRISEAFNLRRLNIPAGAIYAFDDCYAISGCDDSNIKRHKHNRKPILF